MRKVPKPRDPTWRYRRALGNRLIPNKKRRAAKRACRGKKEDV